MADEPGRSAESAAVWVVVAHGSGMDRVCDSLDTAKALCDDALATLSVAHPIIEDWTCVAADGESIWVRYYQSTRWVNGRACDASIEQRITRQPLNTDGKWFSEQVYSPGSPQGGDRS